MQAAIVEEFGKPPRYGEFPSAVAHEHETLVSVRASALSPLVRAQACGKHYSSKSVPMVPGVDGVGYLDDGRRVYFAFPPRGGAMAECVAVPHANLVPLHDDLDDITVAAIANPGMSSWAGLRRAAFVRGESVLVTGANGASGRIAIQTARYLGAGKVIAAARSALAEPELRALGADDFVALNQPADALAHDFQTHINAGVDVVLDYTWGTPAEAFFRAVVSHGAAQAARRIRFVNIGSLAGAEIALNASALRSSGVELMGSGLGSLSHAQLLSATAAMLDAVRHAQLTIAATARPLADVENAWQETGSARLVFTL